MKKIVLFFVMSFVACYAGVSLYEMNGVLVGKENRAKGPKALVKGNLSNATKISKQAVFYADKDSFHVALHDSVHWLEMEKNTDYMICTDDVNDGVWKGADFSFKKKNNCIQLNSGNYVKSGTLWYVTKMGNVNTFNLLVGMKYVDLSIKDHQLGYRGSYRTTGYGEIVYDDSVRYEKMDKILAVDKYKVTECEFVQMLWDSIPSQTSNQLYPNHVFWIEKKRSMEKNGYCDVHDSAAVRVYLYQALIYANLRSLKDGLEPVYSFKKIDWPSNTTNFENEGFDIAETSFFSTYVDGYNLLHVSVSKNANGYRLPFYNEWMALARGAKKRNYKYIWGGVEYDSTLASQYAWFGERNSEDPYFKLDLNDPAERSFMKYSCGEWLQKSRPVGMLKPNDYGLYDMVGLVCENTLLPYDMFRKGAAVSCKGGFLTDSLVALNLGAHCDDFPNRMKKYQGLRLVRQIR